MVNEKKDGLSDEDLVCYVTYCADKERIREIEHRAIINGEEALLWEAVLSNHELLHNQADSLLGEDCFDINSITDNDMENNVTFS